jgi:pyrroline-5-carboxylate reductase
MIEQEAMMIDSILLVGCGYMGGAMLAGWLAAGLPPTSFTVVDPVLAEAPEGVTLLRALPAGVSFDAVLLGVKPQMLADVTPSVAPLTAGATVLSILAGVELATLRARFPGAGAVVRIMPNQAAAMGRSPIALAGDCDEQVTALMEPLGTPEWLPEDQFDLVTALAGSGPAFVYRFIDALAAGAAALGMDAGQAQRLALATVEGASLLAAASPHGPGELARRVASPGGTTQAGLDVLDADAALARLIQATLKAAADRSAEMARASRA